MDHISVQAMGSGDPVILIPGLSSPRGVWDGVAPHLASGHRVYLVQVNGFAGDDPRGNLQPGILDGIVADLDRYIADKKIEHAAIVGHSMGGLVTLMLAKAHPGDAGRVMIVDALPFVGPIIMPGATVETLKPMAAQMRDQMKVQTADAASAKQVAATMAVTPQAQAKVAGWMAASDQRVSAQAMYEDVTTDLRPDMAKVTTPITLVYPTSDRMPAERADPFYRAQYADAPHVTYVPVADSGHFIMLDRPQAFAKALDAFLAE
ncbi:alpha/beta hydrolase [Stakelama sp. CBK3Z-3]|uniref:Alpha/beta hydrolase n=2 Tax=Stakelama flava TaxID=2860338 RepID=A0ABS6XND4_9SPHN|nr:alpha/beta hydrolase [Stakelama flava]